jgi:hypothetical protein
LLYNGYRFCATIRAGLIKVILSIPDGFLPGAGGSMEIFHADLLHPRFPVQIKLKQPALFNM